MKERGLSTAFYIKNVRLRKNSLRKVEPFQVDVDERLSPLKLRLGVYSCRKERPNTSQLDGENVLLSAAQVDSLNRQFEKIKKARHQPIPSKQAFYVHDSLYKSLYLQRHKGLEMQKSYPHERRLPNLSRLSNPQD